MRKIMGLLALLLLPSYAFGQPAVSANPPIGVAGAYNSGTQTCTSGQPCWVQTDVNGKLLTTATSTITGFPTTQTTGTPIAVTTGGVTGTLPSGAVVVASNTGSTNNAYCKLGASATTSDQLIAPTSWFAFTVGAATQLTCITSTSTTTVNMVGGSGIPTGAGGGGGSGGGGGAVTIADGADVTLGAKADSVCGTATGTCTLQALIKFLNTSVTSAIPAGTNQIGTVSADPCASAAKTTAAFTTASGGPVSIVALSGSTKVYVCSISAITDTAIKLSFIDGTGGSCASAQHAIWGSTTAASGMSLAANGGFTQGSGAGTVGVTAAASAFCLLQSGTSLVAGNVTYVQQ